MNAPPVAVAAARAYRLLLADEIASALRAGHSVIVTGPRDTSDFLDLAADQLGEAGVRVLEFRPPLDGASFVRQFAQSWRRTGRWTGSDAAATALPEPSGERFVMLLHEVHSMPLETFRHLERLAQAWPGMRMAFAGLPIVAERVQSDYYPILKRTASVRIKVAPKGEDGALPPRDIDTWRVSLAEEPAVPTLEALPGTWESSATTPAFQVPTRARISAEPEREGLVLESAGPGARAEARAVRSRRAGERRGTVSLVAALGIAAILSGVSLVMTDEWPLGGRERLRSMGLLPQIAPRAPVQELALNNPRVPVEPAPTPPLASVPVRPVVIALPGPVDAAHELESDKADGRLNPGPPVRPAETLPQMAMSTPSEASAPPVAMSAPDPIAVPTLLAPTLAVPEIAGPRPAADLPARLEGVSAGVALLQLGPPISPALADAMTRRGRTMLELGDVSAARLLLTRAAYAGSGEAALVMGTTFDAATLERIGAVGIVANPVLASEWYRLALQRGETEARSMLEAVGASANAGPRATP